jgi:hypothetical protein
VSKRLSLTETEKVLSREVEVRNDETLVERDQRNAEAAENLVGARRARS